VRGDAAWDGTAATFTVTVDDLLDGYDPDTNGINWYVYFRAGDGNAYFLHALRSRAISATQQQDPVDFSFGRIEDGVHANKTSVGVTGALDLDADTVVVSMTQATVDDANTSLGTDIPLLDGALLTGLSIGTFSSRDTPLAGQLLDADTAAVGCQVELTGEGTSSPEPPPEPPTGPDPTLSDGTLAAPGARFEWDSTVMTGAADPTGQLAPTPCARELVGTCSITTIYVGAPGTLSVSATPDLPVWDYDLRVYGPDGALVGSSTGGPIVSDPLAPAPNPTSTESVTGIAATKGVYTVEVVRYVAVESGYHGIATLT
jgi:hypothetical protein